MFGNNDRYENQIEIFQTQIDQQQEKFDELEGVDTPESHLQREQIAQAICDLQVSIERTQHEHEQAQEQQENEREAGLFQD